jgi:hypothetical protein
MNVVMYECNDETEQTCVENLLLAGAGALGHIVEAAGRDAVVAVYQIERSELTLFAPPLEGSVTRYSREVFRRFNYQRVLTPAMARNARVVLVALHAGCSPIRRRELEIIAAITQRAALRILHGDRGQESRLSLRLRKQ